MAARCPAQVSALLQRVGVDERGLVSLDRFNARLNVLPALADAPQPGRLSRCCSLFRRGKKEQLAQYQEQAVLDSASED